MGDGVDSYFWLDRWLEGVPFCVRFKCLFDLAENKSSWVATMFSLGNQTSTSKYHIKGISIYNTQVQINLRNGKTTQTSK